ncbi:putative addiction module killer protein [Erwinia sp. JUb26]|nr:putative addiction module killer protein [Erwinia sp. JUb26]
MCFMRTIKHYLTPDGRDLFTEFFRTMRDSIAKAKIASRINRMAGGNFGDHKPCREGVWELRVSQGAGYRVYYSLVDGEVVLLLLAGDKRTQDADIDEAICCLKDYVMR